MALMNRQQMQAMLRDYGFDDMAFSAMDMHDLGGELRSGGHDDVRWATDKVIADDPDGHGDLRCAHCGSPFVESESFPSFGGTTEGVDACDSCGATHSWLDDEAVR